MKRILLIATGGTIACKQTASGLTPQLGAKELLSYVRDRAENVESIELMTINVVVNVVFRTGWISFCRCCNAVRVLLFPAATIIRLSI